jgi:glucuronate isomerase
MSHPGYRPVAELHLDSPRAAEIFRRHERLPIIDYHSHLSPRRLAGNEPYRDLAELWLDGDHYKWRAMRFAGIAERLCSGEGGPRERFDAWAGTLPLAAGSPLMAWGRLELWRTFGIEEPLTPDSADRIWQLTGDRLRQGELRPRALLEKAGVELLCTTDDPADDLAAHRSLASDSTFPISVLPTFRPDAMLALAGSAPFRSWVERLGAAASVAPGTLSGFVEALKCRHDAFHEIGCRLSDHGIERCYAAPCSDAEAARIFGRLMGGAGETAADELERWRSWSLRLVARWDAERRWTMLLHLGARRDVSSRMHRLIGTDAGCDCIGDFDQGATLAALLDELDAAGALPNTVLFNSNPRDTWVFATIAGSFSGEAGRGRVRHGPPWWFLDQPAGISDYLDALFSVASPAAFVGMVSDSRSPLSTARHELFRRLVCSRLARDIERGIAPDDDGVIDVVCCAMFYHNARSFFGWKT